MSRTKSSFFFYSQKKGNENEHQNRANAQINVTAYPG